jgi:hypothetical protein
MLPEVSLLLCFAGVPQLGRVMLFYDLLYPVGGVENLKVVVISLLFELLPLKGSLQEVQPPWDLGIGIVGNVTRAMMYLAHGICLGIGAVFPGNDLYNFL